MTARVYGDIRHAIDICPTCTGSGEVGTGRREWETGVWETRACPLCDGAGEYPTDHIEPGRDYAPDPIYPAGGWI